MKTSSFFSAFLLLGAFTATAQNAILTMSDGTSAREKQYVDVQGSPFFFDDWEKGEVRLSNGNVEKELDVMYDLVADVIVFKGQDGKSYNFASPVREFKLKGKGRNDGVFRSGFAKNGAFTEQTFFQVLYDGNTKFLKKNNKKIVERPVYGSANINKLVQDNIKYFLVIEGQLIESKLDEKSVLGALDSEKAALLKSFIKQEKLKWKSEEDMVRLLEHYDTL